MGGSCTCSTAVNMAGSTDVRLNQRAVIEFLTVKSVAPIKIHRRIFNVYSKACDDTSTMR